MPSKPNSTRVSNSAAETLALQAVLEKFVIFVGNRSNDSVQWLALVEEFNTLPTLGNLPNRRS